MNLTNLLPAGRLVAAARARSVRRWVKTAGAYSAMVVVACGLISLVAVDGPPADAATVRAELEGAKKRAAVLKATVTAEQSRLTSVMEVSEQVDWSILLSVLSRTLGDDVVLDLVDSGGADGPGQSSQVPEVFTVTGVGRSQPAIAQFVLRLERLGLFSRVELLQTSPRSTAGSDGIGFKLKCTTAVARGEAR